MIERIAVDPNVALLDQQHARALDALREADSFMLVVPIGEGQVRVFVNGDLNFLLNATAQVVEACETALDSTFGSDENGGTA